MADSTLQYLIAFLVLLSTLKLWRLLRLNPKMNIFTATLQRAWSDITGFLLIIVILFAAYSTVVSVWHSHGSPIYFSHSSIRGKKTLWEKPGCFLLPVNVIFNRKCSSVQQREASPGNILPVVPVPAPKLCSGMIAFFFQTIPGFTLVHLCHTEALQGCSRKRSCFAVLLTVNIWGFFLPPDLQAP